jgi:MSHA biogenesis protein MshN
MSLINQMLQDIERRRTNGEVAPADAGSLVQALPVPNRKSMLPKFLGFILLALSSYFFLNLNQLEFTGVSDHALNPPAMTEANAGADVRLAHTEVMTMADFNPKLDRTLSRVSEQTLQSMDQTTEVPLAVESHQKQLKKQKKSQVVATAKSLAQLAYPDVSSQEGKANYKDEMHKDDVSDVEVLKIATMESTQQAHKTSTVAVVNKKINVEQQSLYDYQQAMSYLQQGRVAEAQDKLRNALEKNAGFDDARQALVGLLVENSRVDEAMQVLTAGTTVSPANVSFAQTLARLQFDAGLLDVSLATLEKSLPYANSNQSYHVLLATVLQKLGKHSEAVLHYQQALSNGATTPTWLIGLGVSLEADGRSQEAKSAFEKAQRGQLSPALALFLSQRLKQLH